MKILVISTSGANRISKVIKTLQEDGHEVKILTSKKYKFDKSDSNFDEYELSDLEIVKVPYFPYEYMESYHVKDTVDYIKHTSNTTKENSVKKQLRSIKHKMGSLPELFNFWIYSGYKEAIKLYTDWKYDVVISTYGPVPSHIVASKIKRKLHHDICWIADYRDLWSGNYMRNLPKFTIKLEKSIEYQIVKNADRFMTVSPALTEYLKTLFPTIQTWSIRHGFYKLHDLPDLKEKLVSKKEVVIRYTGAIYDKQDISKLVEAISILNSQSEKRYKLELYGGINTKTKTIIEPYDFVTYFSGVSRDKSILLQQTADILVVLEWGDPQQQGVAPSKMFDYLAAQVPIISVGDYRNDSANIIEEVGIGKFCTTVSEVVEFLQTYKKIFVDKDKLNRYSTYAQMKPLLDYLKGLEL